MSPPIISRLHQRLKLIQDPLCCPLCQSHVLPKDFEKHCSQHHQLKPKLQCVWCLGKMRWPSRTKHCYGDHLEKCSDRAVAEYLVRSPPVYFNTDVEIDIGDLPPQPPLLEYTPFNSTPICPARDFFGERSVFQHPQAYEQLSEPITDALPVPFQDPILNIAASYVRRYVANGDEDWYHIMVRAPAFESFVQSLENEEGGTTHILPFSTLCSGGKYALPDYNHHRHMLLVSSPKGHFLSNVWPKVQLDHQPCLQYNCRAIRVIDSPFYLVNTIGYLSQRQSHCNFEDENRKKRGNHHYYIFTPMPQDYRLALIVQWDGGLYDYLLEIVKNKRVHQIYSGEKRKFGARWRFQIKDVPVLPLNLVMPVSQDFWVSKTPTPHYLCLADGEKVYFERKDISVNDWLQAQAEHGNTFFRVADHLWMEPAYHHQSVLEEIHFVQRGYTEKIKTLENRVQVLEEQMQDLQKKNDLQEQKIEKMKKELNKTKVAFRRFKQKSSI